MKTVSIALSLVALALMTGCGSEPEYVGSWRYTGTTCNGQAVVITGLTTTYEITASSATTVQSVSGCQVTLSDIPVSDSGGTVSINEGAAGSVSCDPNPCSVSIGGVTVTCPDDMPPSGVVYEVGEITGDEMTTTFGGCEQTWVRQ